MFLFVSIIQENYDENENRMADLSFSSATLIVTTNMAQDVNDKSTDGSFSTYQSSIMNLSIRQALENVRIVIMYKLHTIAIEYCREGNFRQLNISYFKFMLGFNFRIVRYAHIHYSIAQKFVFGFNFCMHVNLRK